MNAMIDIDAVVLCSVVAIVGIIGGVLLGWSRWHAKRRLLQCGFPVKTTWLPRFFQNKAASLRNERTLSVSTITRILPRMEALQGPFGMYGAVNGINTKVVHIAHPLPARTVLGQVSDGTFENGASRAKRKTSSSSSLSKSTGASKSPIYDSFKILFGEGTFSADGDDWKQKRTAVIHHLIKGTASSTSIRSRCLLDHANLAGGALIERLKYHNRREEGGIINVVPLLQRATLSFIYRFLTQSEPQWDTRLTHEVEYLSKSRLHKQVNSEATPDSSTDCVSVASTETEDSTHSSVTSNDEERCLQQYLASVMTMRQVILGHARSIWFLLPRWMYRLFASLYNEEKEALPPIHKFANRALSAALPGSPLAGLREAASKDADGCSRDILDETTTLIFAGSDTGSATLSWIVHLLSVHPPVQEKLSEEIKATACSFEKDWEVSRDAIGNLKYLDAVVKESMRLYPAAPFVSRHVQSDIKLSSPPSRNEEGANTTPSSTNGTAVLPAGSVACIWIYCLHRNPRFWDRPNDFIPERWLMNADDAGADIGRTNGAYMPFAAGPRNCVGQSIASVVIRLLLAKLVHKFEFIDEQLLPMDADSIDCPGANKVACKEMEVGFTVFPNDGVKVLVKNRSTTQE